MSSHNVSVIRCLQEVRVSLVCAWRAPWHRTSGVGSVSLAGGGSGMTVHIMTGELRILQTNASSPLQGDSIQHPEVFNRTDVRTPAGMQPVAGIVERSHPGDEHHVEW